MIVLDKPEYFGKLLHKRGFRDWFIYMFNLVEGRKFIVEELHEGMFKEYQAIYDMDEKRLNVNVPPRSAKTSFNKYFIAYTLAMNPSSEFIYTSFSQDLLGDISRQLQNILNHPIYRSMYKLDKIKIEEVSTKPINSFWKNYLDETQGKEQFSNRKIITSAGGIVYFASMGSNITGMGCFDYNTVLATDKGYLKLGDIVEKKLDVKIYSYNIKTKEIELDYIDKYIKNEEQQYIKITLDNGEFINCTDDHIFYDEHFNEILAKDLRIGFKLPSYSFDYGDRNIEFLSKIFSRIIFIKDSINLFLCKNLFSRMRIVPTSLVSNSFCNSPPKETAFNIRDIIISQAILFCYLLIWASIFGNINSLLFGNFGVSGMVSVVLNAILFIIGLCTISNVAQVIVQWVAIKMANDHSNIPLTQKSMCNKGMNSVLSLNSIDRKIDTFISFLVNPRSKNFISLTRKYFTTFIDKVPIELGNRKIVGIHNSYKSSSYCLTIRNNNNMFVGESQVLVHNCGVRNSTAFSGSLVIDDANKPAEIRSEIIRERVHRYYDETLLSRLNDSKTAVVNVQQRLHEDDLTGYLIKKYHFKTFKMPLVNSKGICCLPSQYTDERIKELQVNNYLFLSQYQQEPIKLGGNVIKSKWINYYPDLSQIQFKRLFMVGDTAQKTKEANDYSVIGAFGVDESNLYLIDIIRGKWEAPDLYKKVVAFWEKWKRGVNGKNFNALYIEDKASGTGLIQDIKRNNFIPILAQQRHIDKVTRVDDVLPYYEAGKLYLPVDRDYATNPDIIKECEAFSRDLSHKHDDIVDVITDAFNIGVGKRTLSILDVL